MSRTTHRRRTSSGRGKALGAVVGAAVIGGVAFTFAGTAQAAAVGAAYTKTSGWNGGYTGQYVLTNATGKAQSDWTLEFDLPAGTKIGSLWNGEHKVVGRHVTVKPASWTKDLAPGASVTVGFVASAEGRGAAGDPIGDPTGCLINDVKCSVDAGATPQLSGRPSAAGGKFAPYVDTSLFPAYDLLDTATKTGVKEFNLAFITSGGGCTPLWGGVTDLASDRVVGQIGALRAKGGDVRVSFGGAAGRELALNCSSADELAAAYAKVVDVYKLTKVDFDIEGAALPDTPANTRRAQAIAQLQKKHPGLDVSFTLPVMPEGLTQPGVDLVADAKTNGVKIDAVNVMAMDYGPAYSGDMGTYAVQAATATQAQLKGVLGLSDAAAWKTVAVTPMIGVNDVTTEIFKVDDATQLVKFAQEKGIGWLSMWSSNRDKECPGGAQNSADATCSSIVQEPLAFAKAFATYR